MMKDRLAEAIQLRETGRAKQDQAILEEAWPGFRFFPKTWLSSVVF